MNRNNNLKRTFYKDTYNPFKKWEVVTLKGGYYVRQYIKGVQFGRGVKTSKKFLNNVGILKMEEV